MILKASYILNKCEILFLINSITDIPRSCPAQYLLDQYLGDSVVSQDVAEGLVYKKLAKKSSGKIILEPVIDLLVRYALSSDTLWIVKCADINEDILVLKCAKFYLHVRRYPYISDTWKITPYQSKDSLSGEFDGLIVLNIKCVDKHENNTWIEDGRK